MLMLTVWGPHFENHWPTGLLSLSSVHSELSPSLCQSDFSKLKIDRNATAVKISMAPQHPDILSPS